MTLFERLRHDAGADWHAYVAHDFVHGLKMGTLPPAAFRFYLKQDYLFLIHFARAYALAVYKADSLADMRSAAATLQGILEVEMGLHIKYCAGWGLTEVEMEAEPEHTACTAYTRFVLERGMAGDALDLQVALAPCVIGYGVIGATLARDPETVRAGNPYLDWIEMYAGADYLAVRRGAEDQIERLWTRRGTEARYERLLSDFRSACRLEADFWQMGLDAGPAELQQG
ncbi:MAG: thiaminase II [Rhodospirillaceae bacterium]|nr:thiaminase II [Rhodospirillaceae bacterium]